MHIVCIITHSVNIYCHVYLPILWSLSRFPYSPPSSCATYTQHHPHEHYSPIHRVYTQLDSCIQFYNEELLNIRYSKERHNLVL